MADLNNLSMLVAKKGGAMGYLLGWVLGIPLGVLALVWLISQVL